MKKQQWFDILFKSLPTSCANFLLLGKHYTKALGDALLMGLSHRDSNHSSKLEDSANH